MGEINPWWEHLKSRDNFESLGIDERTILKYVSKNYDGRAWIGFDWLRDPWRSTVKR
jgi:hypothetical protein